MRSVLIVLLALAMACETPPAAGLTSIRDVELVRQAPKRGFANLPAGSPLPVLYFRGNATTTSCGLIEPGATIITPILETEPDEPFPHCLEVKDAAMFLHGGTKGFVFRYRQRDTREDSSELHFFVQQTAAGLRPLDKLNEEKAPQNRHISYMAEWAKTRLIALKNEKRRNKHRTQKH